MTKKKVGWEWAFGTTIHWFNWRGANKGFGSLTDNEFQVVFGWREE